MKLVDCIHLSSVDSTNNYLKNHPELESLPSGFMVLSDEQVSGRGQREKCWLSLRGENLLMSVWIKEGPYNEVFLSKAVANSLFVVIAKVLTSHIQGVTRKLKIKWPNDLLWDNEKVSGILIEKVSRTNCKGFVIGIGLNVNQIEFDNLRATSLKKITGVDVFAPSKINTKSEGEFSRELKTMQVLAYSLRQELFDQLKCTVRESDQFYNNKLFGKQNYHRYLTKSGEIEAKVISVSQQGELRLEDSGGQTYTFKSGEVQLVDQFQI